MRCETPRALDVTRDMRNIKGPDPINEPILQVRGLCKDYRDGDRVAHVLRSLDLTVQAGEFVAIMGPSGCGKTTLLHILGLMAPPTSAADLHIEGTDCLGLSDSQRTRLRRPGAADERRPHRSMI